MQPEGIVHALRHVVEGLVVGGVVVDLEAIEPSGRVEVNGARLGQIDDSAFHERARQATAGLDALAHERLLTPGPRLELDTLVRYASGAELAADVDEASERELPEELAARL